MKRSFLLPLLCFAAFGADTDKPSDVLAPVLTKSVEPQYSLEGRLIAAQGTAVLDVLIDSNGRVSDVRVGQPLGFGLDDQAAAAVRQWRFQPAVKDGVPVATRANIEVDFRLNEGDSARRWLVKEFALDGPDGFTAPVAKQGQVPANIAAVRSNGQLTVKFRITESGSVEGLAAINSTEPNGDTERLLRDIAEWKFVPAQADGKPVAVDATLTLYRGTPKPVSVSGKTAIAAL